jgi:hypothetical protein
MATASWSKATRSLWRAGASDHLDRLDWLGLASADEFNPDVFSVDEANARLAPLVRPR